MISINNLSQRTVLFLIKEKKVLLGYKKTGFGQGNYLGIGGKQEKVETIKEAAAREAKEEIHITRSELQKVGDLTFLFSVNPD